MAGRRLVTLYHGTCVQYSLDLMEVLGGRYLFYDWGKRYRDISIWNSKFYQTFGFFKIYFRFCIPFGKEILMYAYFPGYGIQMSSIDPEFLITETVLRSKGWMDAKLKMVIEEKLPKENSKCQQNEHDSASHLKSIHENHEHCILDAFSQNWSKRNKSCSPFVLENYRAM